MKLALRIGTKIGVWALLAGGAVAVAAPALVKLDIENSGLMAPKMVIEVPAGTKWEEKFTNTLVTNSKTFQIMISQGKEDIAGLKKTHGKPDSTMKEVKSYDIDKPDTLLYEGAFLGGQKGYHFVTNVKLGKEWVRCQDWRKKDGIYSKTDAEAMLASCKTLKKK
jgi:hypothetical protein